MKVIQSAESVITQLKANFSAATEPEQLCISFLINFRKNCNTLSPEPKTKQVEASTYLLYIVWYP